MAVKKVFIHGLGQSAAAWEQTISCLNEQEMALCPEIRSFLSGGGGYTEVYRAFSQYCDVIAEPLDLCGISLGAVLALHYVIEHPSSVTSLVLIAPQYKAPKWLLAVQNALFRLIPEKAFDGAGLTRKEFIALTRSMMELDLSGRIKEVTCPVLVVYGEHDKANRKAAELLAKELAYAKLKIIQNAGHEVNKEAPERLAYVISDFYSKLSGKKQHQVADLLTTG